MLRFERRVIKYVQQPQGFGGDPVTRKKVIHILQMQDGNGNWNDVPSVDAEGFEEEIKGSYNIDHT